MISLFKVYTGTNVGNSPLSLSFFLTVFINMHLLIMKTVHSKCFLITSKCKLILNKVLLGNVNINLASFSTCALNYVLSKNRQDGQFKFNYTGTFA